jgi:hypothetical protein
MSKRRSGKKNLGLTRNQQRKLDYAKLREATRSKRVKVDRSGPTFVHVRPCGNPACRTCYKRIIGLGIYPV